MCSAFLIVTLEGSQAFVSASSSPRARALPPKGPRIIDRPRPGVVRLIDEKGEQLGIMEVNQALAVSLGLELTSEPKYQVCLSM